MIKIRKFRTGDERKLSYLIRKCITTINNKDISKKENAVLFNHFSSGNIVLISQRHQMYVAEIDGEIVGTATLDDDWIRAVFVNPSSHGKGVGTTLMNYLESLILKNGFQSIFLNSSPFAVNFYKKRGYKKIKDIHRDVGKMTVMKKNF